MLLFFRLNNPKPTTGEVLQHWCDPFPGPPLEWLQQVNVLLFGGIRVGHSTPSGVPQEQSREGESPAFDAAGPSGPQVWFCCIMLSFSFINIPKLFSRGLLSVYSLFSLYLCLRLPWHRHRTLYLTLLNFHEVFKDPHLKPVLFPLDVSLPSTMLTPPHILVTSAAEGALYPICSVILPGTEVKTHLPVVPWVFLISLFKWVIFLLFQGKCFPY